MQAAIFINLNHLTDTYFNFQMIFLQCWNSILAEKYTLECECKVCIHYAAASQGRIRLHFETRYSICRSCEWALIKLNSLQGQRFKSSWFNKTYGRKCGKQSSMWSISTANGSVSQVRAFPLYTATNTLFLNNSVFALLTECVWNIPQWA